MDSQNNKFIKYINLSIVHIIFFILIFQSNLEILGLSLLTIINIITNSFLLFDIINSPKSGDVIIVFLVISICAMGVSSLMIFILLAKLHSKYSLQQSPVYLSYENRSLLDNFEISFVTNIILVFIISIFYFTIYRVGEGENTFYLPFYNYKISPNNFIGETIFLILKIIITLTSTGLTGYMLYSSYLLSKINVNKLYIPPNNRTDTIPDKFPHKNTQKIDTMFSNMFSNINLNYIIGYN